MSEVEKNPARYDFEGLAHVIFAFVRKGIGTPDLYKDVSIIAVSATFPNNGHSFARATTQMLSALAKAGVSETRIYSIFSNNRPDWKAGVSARSLFQRVGAHALEMIPAFDPKQLASLLHAFATAGIPDPSLFNAIGESCAADVFEDDEVV